jgi:hypothetical protein
MRKQKKAAAEERRIQRKDRRRTQAGKKRSELKAEKEAQELKERKAKALKSPGIAAEEEAKRKALLAPDKKSWSN